MQLYVGVTDNDWYEYLADNRPDELNFWQPGGRQRFQALQPNELFLFKLHSPLNHIAGGGFFVRHSFLPVSLAWKAFGNKNGKEDYPSFLSTIRRLRRNDGIIEPDPVIGCIVLTMPFFFEQSQWIPVPEDWGRGIQKGKKYNTDSVVGRRLFEQVQARLAQTNYPYSSAETVSENLLDNKYGTPQLVYPRLGQGGFRVVVTEAYNRRCAVSGEKTLPVLEAAHIKPYALEGPHKTSNGLLLRQDIHTLFDRGYITITEDMHVEVSKRIKEDYGNGREYYAFHGKELVQIPNRVEEMPSADFIKWHNSNVYVG